MEDHIRQRALDEKPDARGRPALMSGQTPPQDEQSAGQGENAEPDTPGDLWPEAADARCSESAALFASTQPAPLSVV
jgi:hypothetical protein